jgi:hypothetical protein
MRTQALAGDGFEVIVNDVEPSSGLRCWGLRRPADREARRGQLHDQIMRSIEPIGTEVIPAIA